LGVEYTLSVGAQQAMGARGSRSNQQEVTMATSLSEKVQSKRSDVLEKVDEGKEAIVRCETTTLKWKGFESQMVISTKIYERI
jgi:hypothetical protein